MKTIAGLFRVSIIEFGKTGLKVERIAFGALPIQRISRAEAVSLLRKAFDGGMTYFDTARGYSDSEEKLCEAFSNQWDKVVLSSKTHAREAAGFWQDLETSLKSLGTDCIDIYQFHNPPFYPRPGGEDGLYDAAIKAKAQGKIRHIGITNHRYDVALEAVESGLYETLQFPYSFLSDAKEVELERLCREKGMGFIAMKALSGGLITNSAAACAWMLENGAAIPIFGIQHEWELDEFLSYIAHPPTLDDQLSAVIEADRKDLQGDFCRACGYCMPCPQGIVINMCARASQLMRRAPASMILSDQGQAMMKQIESCTECGQCSAQCPYGLDTPALLKRNYKDYLEVLDGKPL